MLRVLIVALGVVVGLHGLVHLMGFVAYWPLAAVADLPYKTALAAGRWEVGPAGMRVFSVLWLLAALGFVAAARSSAFMVSVVTVILFTGRLKELLQLGSISAAMGRMSLVMVLAAAPAVRALMWARRRAGSRAVNRYVIGAVSSFPPGHPRARGRSPTPFLGRSRKVFI